MNPGLRRASQIGLGSRQHQHNSCCMWWVTKEPHALWWSVNYANGERLLSKTPYGGSGSICAAKRGTRSQPQFDTPKLTDVTQALDVRMLRQLPKAF